jgi:glycosyltransferase involved in cell wall biosynthesis
MKISVVMQSYLGDYPGGRSQPKRKFIRAVQSFLDQTYQNKELIIVSDGCELTKQLYELAFSECENIRFVFLTKNKKEQFCEKTSDGMIRKNFRGIPRKIGCALATGDYICYLDSDDKIVDNYLQNISELCSEGYDMIFNTHFLHPIEKFKFSNSTEHTKIFKALEDKPTTICTSACSVIHKAKYGIYWEDSLAKMNISTDVTREGLYEDNRFIFKLFDIYKKNNLKVIRIGLPNYIICHKKGSWDY